MNSLFNNTLAKNGSVKSFCITDASQYGKDQDNKDNMYLLRKKMTCPHEFIILSSSRKGSSERIVDELSDKKFKETGTKKYLKLKRFSITSAKISSNGKSSQIEFQMGALKKNSSKKSLNQDKNRVTHD